MKHAIFSFVLLGCTLPALADEQEVTIRALTEAGPGNIIGTVKLGDSDKGLTIEPKISQLAPGAHGFHVHEKPSCDSAEKDGKMVPGQAAGSHFDPHASGKHEGPEGHGHHGDLPVLLANDAGVAAQPLLAPRLKLADIKGRALMIHAGGDNYSDQPKPLGGGGGRIACGVIE